MTVKKRNFLTVVWDFFCSLKLTIITLILLAVTSIIGTIIPQTANPQENLQRFGETKFKIFQALDFFDMYHSWWFLGLLSLVSLNLIACSIKRLPKVMKTVKEPKLIPDESHYRSLSNRVEYTSSLPASELREKVASVLRNNFAAPVINEEGERVHFFAQKGPWARFGVYVTHLSILIIFAGAIIGNGFGYKAFVNIVEGDSTDVVWPRGGDEPIELGFTVVCEDFWVEYYPDRRPKDYFSELVVVEDGQEVMRKTIEVNHPLTYKGITFYQSSFGPAGDPTFELKVTERGTGEEQTLSVRQGQPSKLSGGSSLRVVGYAENFQGLGGAARVEIIPESGKRRVLTVLREHPDFDVRRGGEYILSLVDVDQKQYTGLQVAKDPGVWVVWIGCILLVIGCMVAFFVSHRRIWVTIMPLKGKSAIVVGGTAHRNQPGFEIYFEELKKQFDEEINPRA